LNDADRVAVVTGAGSGIGRALAMEAGRRGMRVAIVDVDKARVAETLSELQRTGVVATSHVLNVADAVAMESLADAVYQAHGDVHLLFNNAGVHLDGVSWRHSEKQWKWLMDIDFMGVVHGVNAFLPRMLDRGQEGIIANTASIAGLMSFPYSGCYCAAKHAVVGFTESVHLELTAAGSRIKVALICPGAVATEIARPPAAVAAPYPVGGGAARDPRVDEFRAAFSVVIENGMHADEHGRLVFDELAQGAFWIISDPAYLPLMEERLRSIKERRAPGSVSIG
jgi:NADP-dependent 3-hydroxy acid dehydrogenase YdfG